MSNINDLLFKTAGFGFAIKDDWEVVEKAISAGHTYGGTDQTGGASMRVEYLDNTLADLAEKKRQIVFMNDIAKRQATSTVVEYVQKSALGFDRDGGWVDEGELPPEDDPSYARKVALIKYLGTTRSITLVQQLTRNIVQQNAESIETGIMWVMKQLERYSFKGNAKLGFNGNEFVEPDGLETYIERDASADHVINNYGDAILEEQIRDAGQVIVGYNGFATHAYLPQPIKEDYCKAYLPHYYVTQDGSKDRSFGYRAKELTTEGGDYALRGLYLYNGLTREQPPTTVSTNAPTPLPTVSVALQAATDGKWDQSLGVTASLSGSVSYRVTLGNKYGESSYVASSAQAITNADIAKNVRVTITNPGTSYGQSPTYAAIYRQDTNGDGSISTWGCVKRLSLTSLTVGGTAVTWDDNGTDMPGTYRAWVGSMDPMVIRHEELLRISNIVMPKVAFANRNAIATFCAQVCRIPVHWTMIKNIGRRTT